MNYGIAENGELYFYYLKKKNQVTILILKVGEEQSVGLCDTVTS